MIGKVKAQMKIGGANKKIMIKAGGAFVLLSAWMEENFNKKEYQKSDEMTMDDIKNEMAEKRAKEAKEAAGK
jgi:hypothetical protein